MSAPTKRAPARKRTPAKSVKPPMPERNGAPRVEAGPPAEGMLSPREQRIQALTGIDPMEAIQILQRRVGELETQRIMDGTIIGRLVQRVQELDPDDPVAAQAAASQEDQ